MAWAILDKHKVDPVQWITKNQSGYALQKPFTSLHKKPGALEEYVEQIEKGKSQGMLIDLSQKEVESLKVRPHFFTHHGVVYKPNSLSTSVRLVNNTAILVRGATTTLGRVIGRVKFLFS